MLRVQQANIPSERTLASMKAFSNFTDLPLTFSCLW
jgi:hypothetical protein